MCCFTMAMMTPSCWNRNYNRNMVKENGHIISLAKMPGFYRHLKNVPLLKIAHHKLAYFRSLSLNRLPKSYTNRNALEYFYYEFTDSIDNWVIT